MRRFVAVVLLAASIAGAATASASAPPRGLTSYGRITWNLDALVRDFYGGARTCFRVQTFSIHRCQQPGYNDGLYQATLAAARGSAFRTVRRSIPWAPSTSSESRSAVATSPAATAPGSA
jgi:hypothetical protein